MPRGRRQSSSSKSKAGVTFGDTENEVAASREGTRSSSLSEERLAHHDRHVNSPQPDYPYATNVIREEQRRNFHQAFYEHEYSNTPEGSVSSHAELPEHNTRRFNPSIEENLGLYSRPVESFEDPLRRFATLDGASDPHPLYAKREMRDLGIAVGDLETAQRRTDAAEQSTKQVQGMKRTNSATTGRITGSEGKRRRRRGNKMSEKTSEREEDSSEH